VSSSDLEGSFCGGPSALASIIIARAGSSSDTSSESSVSSVVSSISSVQWF
jgi:hypothetical protein